MNLRNTFDPKQFQQRLFNLSPNNFEPAALELFQFQYKENVVYKKYCDLIGVQHQKVKSIDTIPFLPISFFKSHEVKTSSFEAKEIFTSSGTSSSQTSKHYIKELSLYEKSFEHAFEHFYGNVNQYRILALLPSYLERKGSSLVYMAKQLIDKSNHTESGFFLDDLNALNNTLNALAAKNKKVLLIGVSFGLLDFIEAFKPVKNSNLIVMETGGMKGKRKELIREELHKKLIEGLQTDCIHSEYGMTELLSQAYSSEHGKFSPPNWMKVLIRKFDDPFSFAQFGETGGINIIDLANIYSCAFIQTDDLGKKINDTNFEILGRYDKTTIRGCNLMVV